MIESGLMERYLETNSGQTAFSLAGGFVSADPGVTDANHRVFGLGVAASGRRYRGVDMVFFGDGAEDTTFAYKVWTVHRGKADGTAPSSAWQLRLFCSGAVTLSTAVGVGSTGQPIKSTERIADAITVTNEAWGTASISATGSAGPKASVPAANTPAVLKIDDLGGAFGVIVEFDLTGATGANVAIETII